MGFNVEKIIEKLWNVPGVRINREEYLRSTFKRRIRDKKLLEKIIIDGPVEAGMKRIDLYEIAKDAANAEILNSTMLSFASGLPGGLAMGLTIPADAAQFFACLLRFLQKILYLYGWDDDIYTKDGDIDEKTKNIIYVYLGVMFGVKTASTTLMKVLAKSAVGSIRSKALKSLFTKGISGKLVRAVINRIGIISSGKLFASSSKAIPIVGGVASGGITCVTFKGMSEKLIKFIDKQVFEGFLDSEISEDVEDIEDTQE